MDAVYCHNHLGYDIDTYEETVNEAGGIPGRGWTGITETSRGVDCRFSTLPQTERGELQGCCWRLANDYRCGIPTTVNLGPLTILGGSAELLPG